MKRLFLLRRWLFAPVIAGPLACAAPQATIPAPGARPESGPPPPALTCGGAPLSLGPGSARRLSREEYRNAIADLFGVSSPAASELPEDGSDGRFRSTAGQRLTAGAALKYFEAAGAVGRAVARDLPRLLPCATDELAEGPCIERFLATNGTRIFRRRLAAEERAEYAAVFARARAAGSPFPDAVAALVQAMLSAPAFLFLLEPAPAPAGASAGAVQPLDSWQVAARLSFLLWRTTPDVYLLEAAARDELRAPAAIAAHVRRLLEDERARPAVAAFFDGWLALDGIEEVKKDEGKYPQVKGQVVRALAQETRRYLAETFWRDGDFESLMVSKMRIRNKDLSKLYGDDLGKEEALGRYQGAVSERSFGLLSQAGLLMAMSRSNDAAIIHRGVFLRRRLLCGAVAPPPPGIIPPLPKVRPGMSARAEVEEHTAGPQCFGCHSQINPLGFALEHFDGAGRWRDDETGAPIDATAEIDEAGIDGRVSGALELSRGLASSPVAQDCFVARLFEYAVRREPTAADACVLGELQAAFRAARGNLKAALIAVANSPAMRAQSVEGPPSSPRRP